MKHKARLVTKGYAQQFGVDYNEVFAPVARLKKLRLILAYAAIKNWEVHPMDVKTTFLNNELEEEVYIVQPEGFVDRENPNMVLKLSKALYGLKQAPRAWNFKLDQCLQSLGFVRCPQEYALYKKINRVEVMIISIYVDDLIIVGSNKQVTAQFKEEMQQKFEMSDLGLGY